MTRESNQKESKLIRRHWKKQSFLSLHENVSLFLLLIISLSFAGLGRGGLKIIALPPFSLPEKQYTHVPKHITRKISKIYKYTNTHVPKHITRKISNIYKYTNTNVPKHILQKITRRNYFSTTTMHTCTKTHIAQHIWVKNLGKMSAPKKC